MRKAGYTLLELRDRPVILVADKSFFHDAWRTDYESKSKSDAEWLFAYILTRRALGYRERILATSLSVVDRISAEFKAYADIPAQVALVILQHAECYPIPGDVGLGLAPIYVAKRLSDDGRICLIVSSVKRQKWLDRLRLAGVTWEVKGFDASMSDQRAMSQAWFASIGSPLASRLLETLDSAYKEVVGIIGGPEEWEGE